MLLILTTQCNLGMHQHLDVKKTVLKNFLDEDIYLFMPKGLPIPPNPQIICKLLKSLYGLKFFQGLVSMFKQLLDITRLSKIGINC
jgi:hypothetical protein